MVIGLVGPLGTDTEKIRAMLATRLQEYCYSPVQIRLSKTVIPALAEMDFEEQPEFICAMRLIDAGNRIRAHTKNNAIMAIAAARAIALSRPRLVGNSRDVGRTAYIVSSLKRPEEVAELRKIYGKGFYLFAIHTENERRLENLMTRGQGMTRWEAEQLLERDEHEYGDYGQDTRGTFHLADFFVADENNDDKLRNSLNRCLDVIFGHPHLTPSFNEYAMFMAFASSVRSADLSRQVGAVIARKNEILSTGANDCPAAGGGLYWPTFIGDRIDDHPRGRDYKRGYDSNSDEKEKLITSIVEKFPKADRKRAEKILRASGLTDITEYGRVVHAEMEALLACARSNISTVGATLYGTTFPCHNCAKHIVAAGIDQVIYIEPYPKSKAFKFHDDSITAGKIEPHERKVRFKPFIGIGPRLFFDLFSMTMSAGRQIVRKDAKGQTVKWTMAKAKPRIPIFLFAYSPYEDRALSYLKQLMGGHKK